MKHEAAIQEPKQDLRSQFALWSELVKLRLTTMVLITTAMGFYLASVNGFDWALLLHALFGTGILAGGAAALNEYLEKDFDAKILLSKINSLINDDTKLSSMSIASKKLGNKDATKIIVDLMAKGNYIV